MFADERTGRHGLDQSGRTANSFKSTTAADGPAGAAANDGTGRLLRPFVQSHALLVVSGCARPYAAILLPSILCHFSGPSDPKAPYLRRRSRSNGGPGGFWPEPMFDRAYESYWAISAVVE